MSLTIAGTTFEQHHYESRGDVLYLSVEGYDGPPADTFSTPEGHNVEYDPAGHVIGMTPTNVRWLLERDGEITITWPAGHGSADDLAGALQPAVSLGYARQGGGAASHTSISSGGKVGDGPPSLPSPRNPGSR